MLGYVHDIQATYRALLDELAQSLQHNSAMGASRANE
jgi:hypothetical protein